jgi:hypothetical protein
MIPRLDDLDWDVPDGFVETYVRLHQGEWHLARLHWARVVRRVLNTDAVARDASGRTAMRQAVAAASRLLRSKEYRARCPICPRRKSGGKRGR